MPRKVTESAKKKRLEKQQRTIEKPTDLPDNLKQATIEFLYRTGKEAKDIIEVTGIRSNTVYDNINRIKETESAAPKPKTGRPVTDTSKENILRAFKMFSFEVAVTGHPVFGFGAALPVSLIRLMFS